MRITRVSSLTGIQRTREVDIRPDELDQWRSGVHPDISLSRLSSADREFVTTGICDLDHQLDRMRSEIAALSPPDRSRLDHHVGPRAPHGDGRRECPCCGASRSATRRATKRADHGGDPRSRDLDNHQVPGGWKLG